MRQASLAGLTFPMERVPVAVTSARPRWLRRLRLAGLTAEASARMACTWGLVDPAARDGALRVDLLGAGADHVAVASHRGACLSVLYLDHRRLARLRDVGIVGACGVHDSGLVLDVDQLAAGEVLIAQRAALMVIRAGDVPAPDDVRGRVALVAGLARGQHAPGIPGAGRAGRAGRARLRADAPAGGVRALPAQREVLAVTRPDISRRGLVRPQPVDAVVAVHVLMPVRRHSDNDRIAPDGEPAHGLHAVPGDVQLGRLRLARFRPHAVQPLPDRVRPADHRHRVALHVRPPSFRDGADTQSMHSGTDISRGVAVLQRRGRMKRDRLPGLSTGGGLSTGPGSPSISRCYITVRFRRAGTAAPVRRPGARRAGGSGLAPSPIRQAPLPMLAFFDHRFVLMSGRRADLLAEVAGIFEGASEGGPQRADRGSPPGCAARLEPTRRPSQPGSKKAAAGKRTRTGRRSQTRTTGARVFRDRRGELADVDAGVTKPASIG